MNKPKDYKYLINEELENYFNNKIKNIKNNIIKDLLIYIKGYTLRGGKRIRPLLIINSYKCFKDYNEELIKASLFIELIQTYLLIHDDVMDRDDLRRGGPTIHKIYSDIKKDNHFGNSMAINAGDLVCSFVYDSIIDLKFDEKIKFKVINEINKLLEFEVHGQILDIFYDSHSDLKEEDIIKIYSLKTAPYTSIFPLRIGAIFSEASDNDLRTLEEIGMKIGIAFQIKDDNLSIFGEEKIGKCLYNDIKEGKKTLIFVKALELCNQRDKEFLKGYYGKENIMKENIEEIKRIFIESGSLDYCNKLSKKLLEESKRLLSQCNFREEGINSLIKIFDYIIEREI